jgi:Zn-dependent oligopeptidase
MGEQIKPRWDNEVEYRRNAPDYSEFRYDVITAKDIDWIIDDVVSRAHELAEQIAATDELTWDATMGRLHKIGSLQEYAYGRACFMAEVHPDKTVRETAYEALYRFFDDVFNIYFNQGVYQKIKEYSESDDAYTLEGERAGALRGLMQFFESIGHELPKKKREIVQQDYRQIIRNEIAFQRNIDDDKTVVPLTREELDGMSQDYIDSLQRDDQGRYLVTMQYPHVYPLIDGGHDWQARHKVRKAFDSRAINLNRDLLEETTHLRYHVARKLGFVGWSQYIFDLGGDMMAKSAQEVEQFHFDMLHYLEKPAVKEMKMLEKMLRADGREGPVLASDMSYYLNKARQEAIPYDEEKVAEYFPLDAVMEGMNALDEQMFGLQYRRLSPEEYPVWHPDVVAYEVTDTENGRKGKMLFDLFPREGKYSHAAAFPLQYGYVLPDGTRQDPVVAIVCNFSRSGLLTQQNINYLIHERGHGKHMICGQTEEISHSGFNVEWDNVELPSQITEYFMFEPEILQSISRHHKTGEQIPDELAKAICDSERLYKATEIVLKIAKGQYDLEIHDKQPIGDFDHYIEIAKEISPFFQDDGAYFPATFAHLMGGYDSGFYGYQFSRVRAAIMYRRRFKAEGLTNPETGREFKRAVLNPGGTEYGHDMYRKFAKTGRVSIKEYLRQEGIKL